MGEKRVRICDIAEELGLSTATVSNVLHGKTEKISDETVKRVQALSLIHILCVLMFVGRVGPLSLFMAFTNQPRRSNLILPEGKLIIG